MKHPPYGSTVLQECAALHAAVVVIGGGMAGTWVSYQLAKAGVQTILISYGEGDRGGVQGASRRSAGALSLLPLSERELDAFLQRLGRNQTHPSVAPALSRYFSGALEELRTLLKLKPIRVGCALESGCGEEFVTTMKRLFIGMGGVVVDGWVTRVVAGPDHCHGVQYESRGRIGKILCDSVVIATGGYTGLFQCAIRTHCFGNLLGTCLELGAHATNLEFLFKHGYGNVDANSLTPTEELPGAEIYNERHERVRWLEEMLFSRMGTKTHLQAVQHWLRNPSRVFYVDLSYRPLYLKLCAADGDPGSPRSDAMRDEWLAEVVSLFPESTRNPARLKLTQWLSEERSIRYDDFEDLKPLLKVQDFHRFRVRPLTYFSMGGVGHTDFLTGLRNIYVTGEAMHDFGANRVGGLPWSLYLASGFSIAEQIVRSTGRRREAGSDFELIHKPSRFDPNLLREIQGRLHRFQEMDLNAARAEECMAWLRETRRSLRQEDAWLHDGTAWLLAAEAIMACSHCRAESRGFFFRADFQDEDEDLDGKFTYAWHDEAEDRIVARLLPMDAAGPTSWRTNRDSAGNQSHGALAQHC